jgi:hypothetical protein
MSGYEDGRRSLDHEVYAVRRERRRLETERRKLRNERNEHNARTGKIQSLVLCAASQLT